MAGWSPQAPQCGDYLKTNRNGEYPFRVGNILRPAAISPKNSTHENLAPAATTNFLNPSLIHLLYLSTNPFALGWALNIKTWEHPMLSRYVLNTPWNSSPRSERTRAGGPYRHVTFSWNQCITVALVLSVSAPTSIHLDMGSTATIACTSPLGPPGVRLVTRSTHH